MIDYRIDLGDAHSHHFTVTLTVPAPHAEQQVSLPVWIVGSYMVRDFSRHLSGLVARQGRREVTLQQLDKSSWRVACAGRGALTLRYRVYAFDNSVRAAFLDSERGFFNASSLCLRVHGHEGEPHRLQLARLPGGWEVATAMAQADDHAVAPHRYQAQNFDELVDHPFELGRFWRGEFEAGGVPHSLVVAGALPGFDGDRLLADARRICQQQIDFWHPASEAATPSGTAAPPPFDRYVFLLNAVGEGFGGLEHRASTALIAARRDLPRLPASDAPFAAPAGMSEGYVTLLGLISHEYFHSWNVKRLKPAELASIAHQAENYTELLWFFEGFTSYYDDLALLRCGLIDAPRYLRLLAASVNALAASPGRQVQSVAQASFDAWTKYYKTDENTPNATVSYYRKGALVALAFDLTLRQSGGSLDAVMRALWQCRGGAEGGGPISEADIAACLSQVAGRDLHAELRDWVHGTDELPLAELLAASGVELRPERVGFAAALGLRLSEGALSGVQVKVVLAGSAAAQAGVAAGDELLAVDGWRIRRLDEALGWIARDQPFELLLARDARVKRLRLRPDAASPLDAAVSLHLQTKPGRAMGQRRRAWLGV